MLMLCYHSTYSANLLPCNLPSLPPVCPAKPQPLPCPSCRQQSSAVLSLSRIPVQQEEKEWDLGCTPHPLPPVLLFPLFLTEHGRGAELLQMCSKWKPVVSRKGTQKRCYFIFSGSRGDGKVLHCQFELQLLLLNPLILIYSKIKVKGHLMSGSCS